DHRSVRPLAQRPGAGKLYIEDDDGCGHSGGGGRGVGGWLSAGARGIESGDLGGAGASGGAHFDDRGGWQRAVGIGRGVYPRNEESGVRACRRGWLAAEGGGGKAMGF